MSGPERFGAAARHDVVVVGDGPAGSALSAALADADVDVLLVGADAPWSATYGTWLDDLPNALADRVLATTSKLDAIGTRHHELAREYGVFDNERLRAALRRAPHRIGEVASAEMVNDGVRLVTGERDVLLARLVFDATGAAPALLPPLRRPDRTRGSIGWQTAYGLVLDERPPGVHSDRGVLMDWRPPGTAFDGEATFLYAIPVGGGRWLAEETSLARREPMTMGELRVRLAARLGTDLTDRAAHVEHVVIPMRSGVPDRGSRVVGFGAAARYLHPATGFSVTASLRAAPRVATAVASALDANASPDELARRAWNAVWPSPARHTRALHDRGLRALLRMRPHDLRAFFDAFFALPASDWADYLRIDASPLAVSRTMAGVFSSVPWSLRRRLAMGSPRSLIRSLRPPAPRHASSPLDARPAPSRRARTR